MFRQEMSQENISKKYSQGSQIVGGYSAKTFFFTNYSMAGFNWIYLRSQDTLVLPKFRSYSSKSGDYSRCVPLWRLREAHRTWWSVWGTQSTGRRWTPQIAMQTHLWNRWRTKAVSSSHRWLIHQTTCKTQNSITKRSHKHLFWLNLKQYISKLKDSQLNLVLKSILSSNLSAFINFFKA